MSAALAVAIGLVGCGGEEHSEADTVVSSAGAESAVAVSELTVSTSSPPSTTATPASTMLAATTPAVEPTDAVTTTLALADALIGRGFTVNDISNREIVPGRPIVIYFNDPTNAAIQTGCNGINAAWTITDAVLVLSDVFQGELPCPEPAMVQEEFITSFLRSGPSVRLTSDGMTLTGADATILTLAG